jgi:hypothetical protein
LAINSVISRPSGGIRGIEVVIRVAVLVNRHLSHRPLIGGTAPVQSRFMEAATFRKRRPKSPFNDQTAFAPRDQGAGEASFGMPFFYSFRSSGSP